MKFQPKKLFVHICDYKRLYLKMDVQCLLLQFTHYCSLGYSLCVHCDEVNKLISFSGAVLANGRHNKIMRFSYEINLSC